MSKQVTDTPPLAIFETQLDMAPSYMLYLTLHWAEVAEEKMSQDPFWLQQFWDSVKLEIWGFGSLL